MQHRPHELCPELFLRRLAIWHFLFQYKREQELEEKIASLKEQCNGEFFTLCVLDKDETAVLIQGKRTKHTKH